MALSRTPKSGNAHGVSRSLGKLGVYLLCIGIGALMLFPLLWLVRSSVMDLGQIFVFPPE